MRRSDMVGDRVAVLSVVPRADPPGSAWTRVAAASGSGHRWRVEIVSFDRDAGHHISHYGSDFVLAPIMGAADTARTVFIHLGPGGVVGEHETTTRQVFCVVTGQGWVSGADRVRVPIKPFQAAHWAPGELHAAGTESGLVAAVIEGTFTVEGARRAAGE